MLSARNLFVTLRNRPILNGVSVDLRPNELLAIIGPNGAGKSTLLAALSGTLSPTAGDVTLDGVGLCAHDLTAVARRRAVLPQWSALNFGFQVIDVVLMGRSPHRGYTSEREDMLITCDALKASGIAHLKERQYTTLSGGERQRVQLARALAQIWPTKADGIERYLLLDEPTNNLDLAHQHHILHRAKAMTRSGVGVLAILHEPNLASFYADRIALLENGRITACGTPRDVLTEDRLGALYGLNLRVIDHPERHCPQILTA